MFRNYKYKVIRGDSPELLVIKLNNIKERFTIKGPITMLRGRGNECLVLVSMQVKIKKK